MTSVKFFIKNESLHTPERDFFTPPSHYNALQTFLQGSDCITWRNR